jgi:hypothetical protein
MHKEHFHRVRADFPLPVLIVFPPIKVREVWQEVQNLSCCKVGVFSGMI